MRITPQRAIAATAIVIAAIAGLSCSDSTGPRSIDPPTGVAVTMTSPTAARVTWTGSAQADLVVSYNVFRNGTKIGESTTTSYQDDGLAELTVYKYAVSANGRDGQVSGLSAETPASTITVPDVTPPRVISSTPADGVTGVARSAAISVTFSEAIDPATINTSTFQVKIASAGAITGTVAYTAATRTAQFTPSAPLPNAAGMSVGITTGVKDLAGNALATTHSFGFAVRDEVAPTVVSVNPAGDATGVPVGTSVTAVFSEPMDGSTINASTVTLWFATGAAAVAGAVAYDATARAVTFTPAAPLSVGTSYAFGISTGAKDASGNSLAQAFASVFTTAAASDATPPSVTAVNPPAGATGVAIGTAVSLSFSEPMSAATVTASSLTLTSAGGAVTGSVTLNSAGDVATFTPAAALQNGTTYTITATTAMKDLAGNSLASQYTSSFTTAAVVPVDNTPPTVVSSVPSNGAQSVAVTTPVRVTFSEDMNPSTVNGSTFTLSVGGAQVSGSVSYDPGSRIATFSPGAGLLAEGQSYTGTVTTGVKDVAGNAMASTFMFSFTTVAPVDNTPPTIVSRNPSPGATGVPTSTTIRIGFSEPMNPSTITTSTFTVASGGNIAGSVAYDPASRIATFTPASALSNGVTYTVTITTGVRDVAGNALASTDVFTFKTAQTNISGMYGAETWWQTTTRDGAPTESTNPDSASVHIHFVFGQNGDALSLNSECSGGLNDRCITLARNVAGQTATGPNSPGYVWVLLTGLTGTLDGTAISFTVTNANGKTFSFTGTLNTPYSMSGTISGPTIPTEQVTFTRPLP